MRTCALFLLIILALLHAGRTLAREQWQMSHPDNPFFPTANPAVAGLVPQFTPDFWQGTTTARVPPGTVLSGILMDDLSSAKNKPGDVFEVRLQDGFSLNGMMVIPPNSKIIGAVTAAVPAKTLHHGHPGQLKVSLQSLVLPDGRNTPIYAFIDRNPNAEPAEEPRTSHLGASLSDYGQQVASFFQSFGMGVGAIVNRVDRGLDFQMRKGDVLPVRITRTLDLPGLKGTGVIGGCAACGLRRLEHSSNVTVPGLVGEEMQVEMSAPPAVPKEDDPNSIFNQPINPRPAMDSPDPF